MPPPSTFAQDYPDLWARASEQAADDRALLARLVSEGKVARVMPTPIAPRRIVRGADTIRPKGQKGRKRR